MRFLLSVFLTFFLFTFPVFGQSEKPQTIIVPTGSLGEISETRIKILEKTLESKLDDYFDIVPKQLFEEAQEKAFEKLDYEECTEDQCFALIQQILQVDNLFLFNMTREGSFTQLSLTRVDLDSQRLVRTAICEDCGIGALNAKVEGMVRKILEEDADVIAGTPIKEPEPEPSHKE